MKWLTSPDQQQYDKYLYHSIFAFIQTESLSPNMIFKSKIEAQAMKTWQLIKEIIIKQSIGNKTIQH